MQDRRNRNAGRALRIVARLAVAVTTLASVALVASPAFASAPTAATINSVRGGPGVGQMTVRWSAPTSDGGVAITSYEYEVSVDGGAFSAPATLGIATARYAAVSCSAPQSPGHGCAFQVRANNGTPGAWSAPVSGVWSAPGLPMLGRATAGPAVGQATLAFRPPKSTGGLTVSYQYAVNDGTGWSAPQAISPAAITQTRTIPSPVFAATVACSITTPGPIGCSYRLYALNAVGSSTFTPTRIAYLRRPGPVVGLQGAPASVALGTGAATQSVSWSAPTSTGGLAITLTRFFACATAGGTLCHDESPDWVKVADYAGSPATVNTTYACPGNGRCAYEAKAYNALGPSWRHAYASPAGPTGLVATQSTTTVGAVDLSWNATIDPGSSFGHYVLFECLVSDNCALGTWSGNPLAAVPWTRVDLTGTGTATSFACGVVISCMFRVGYVDGSGTIAGVTNAVTAVGLDAPTLTATSGVAAGTVDLSWTPPTSSLTITSYQIDRDAGSGFTNLAIVPGNQTTYTDTSCPPSTLCGYKMRAFYTVGTSGESNTSSAMPSVDTALTLTTPAAATTSDATPTFSGSAGSATGDSATVTVEIHTGLDTSGAITQTLNATRTGASWTIDATTLADGTYTAQAKQTNFASLLLTTTPVTFTVDTTAPAVTLTKVNGATVTFPFTGNATIASVGGACGTATGDSATVAVAIGGAATENGAATCTAGAWTYTLVTALSADGAYTATATQTDSVTNTGATGAKSMAVDKGSPVVGLTTVNAAFVTFPFTGSATVVSVGGACGSASGDSASVSVSIGGAASENGTATCTAGTWTYALATALSADGAYTATATQTDTAGNTGTSGTKNITIDKTAPAVTLTNVNASIVTFPFTGSATVASVGGTCGTAAGDNTTIFVAIGGAATENGSTACIAGAWTYTLVTALSGDGAYTATATQTDSVTNTGTSGTKSITVDKAGPAVGLTTVNASIVTFPFTTNTNVVSVGGACGTAPGDNATVSIAIGGAATENGAATCTAGAWTYTLVTALSAGGAYTATATQSDSVGNTATSGAKSITVDKTAPGVTLTAVNASVVSFPFIGNVTVVSVGGACGIATGDSATVAVAIGGAAAESGTTTCAAGNWTYTLVTALSASGAYTATATQADTAGNGGTSGAKSITVDKAGPAVTLTNVNGSAVTFPLTGNATIASVGGACGTASGDNATVAVAIGGAATENGSAPCTAGNWTYNLVTALSVNGAYTATATQSDSVGNTGTSGTQSITVDKAAPTVILTNVNGSAVSFPFTTNTNITTVGGTCGTATGDSTSVAVVIGGAASENGTATCATGTWTYTLFTVLSVSGAYTATATQADAAGNSGTSGTKSITVDTTGPAVTLTNVNGAAAGFPLTSNTTVASLGGTCGTAAGDSASVSVAIGGATSENGTATCTAGNWTYALVTALSGDGVYTATATQTDGIGNIGTSGAKSITVDKTGPAVTLTKVNGSSVSFPFTGSATVVSVGGACGTAAGDNATINVAIGGAATENGSAPCSAGNWTYTLATALSADGAYTATATQSDSVGNLGSSGAKSVTVDKAGPAVTLTNVNGSAVSFPFTGNATITTVGGACSTAPGDNATINVAIGGAATENGTATCTAGNWTYTLATALSASGAYTTTATQSDSVGNTGTSGSKSITVDKTAPAVGLTTVNAAIVTLPFTTNTNVVSVGGVCGTATGDSATINVAIGGAATENGTTTCTAGNWTYTLTTSLSTSGSYTATATQSDTGGNTGTSGTKSITVDKTAPAVTLTNVNGSAVSFPFTGNANVVSVGGACGTATGDSATINVAIGGAATENGTTTCTAGNWTYTLVTALSADGAYTAIATQADSAGNTGSTGTKSITVDKAGPAVTLTTVNGSSVTFPFTTNTNITTVGGACSTAAGDNPTINVAIGGAATESGTTTCTAGNWTYALVTALSTGGAYTATATQSDSGGNTGTSGAKSITVDKTAPAVTLTSVNGSAVSFPFTTNTNITTVGGTCGAATGDSATINVAIGGAATENGTTTCTAGNWTYALVTALSTSGAYTATATQADSAGNTGSTGTKSVTVDKAGPAVTLTNVNGSSVTFPFTTNTNITTVGGACSTAAGDNPTINVAIGGAATENGTTTCTAGNWTYTLTTSLSTSGAYTATATQSDSGGNTGTSGTKSITVDKTAPAVTLTAVNATTVTFPFTTNTNVVSVGGACGTATGDNPTINVAIGGAATENGTATCTAGNWTYTLVTALSANGAYTATAVQTDSAGNAGITGTKSITVDKTGPAVTLTNVNGSSVTFPFTGNATIATVGGSCGTATGDGASVSVAIGGAATENGTAACTAGSWTYALVTALSASGTYTATATQSDTGGNTGSSGTKSIVVDKTAPAVTLTNLNGSGASFPFIGNATVTSVGGACGTATGDSATVSVAIGGAATENGATTCTAGAWTYTLTTSLSASGTYTATATQSDSVGNTGSSSSKSINLDLTAPTVTIANVNASPVGFPFTGNATIVSIGGACGTAAGDSASVSVAIGGAATENGTATCTAGAWTYSLVTALSASGTYTATATQSDTGGNTGSSGTKSITVDKTAPAVTLTSVNASTVAFPFTGPATVVSVGGTCGTATGDSATVSVAIGGAATENGAATCVAGAWTYTLVSALSADGAYTATATQSDSAGNTGTSGAQSVTVDTAAPAVTITSPTNLDTTSTTPTITGDRGTATGDLATVTVNIYAGALATGTPVQTLSDTNSGATWSVDVAALIPGVYTVQATQTDSAGNIGLSGSVTITAS